MADDSGSQVSCPACGKSYRWQATLAGRTVPCKQCGESFIVPDQPGPGLALEPTTDDGLYELQMDEEDEEDEGPGFEPRNKCPSCNSPLREGAVLCMNCGFSLKEGRKMDAPAVSAMAPEERKEADKELTGMKWVRVGLWLNLASILLMFAMIPLPIAAGIAGFDYLLVIGVLAYLSLGASTLGSLFCLTAPKESRGRPVLIPSVILSLVSTGMLFVIDLGMMEEHWWWAVDLMSIVATVLFLLFFVRLAEYLDFDQIIDQARKVVGLYVTIELLGFAVLVPLPLIGCIFAVALLATAIYTLCLYIGLLIDLNNALTYRIGEQSE